MENGNMEYYSSMNYAINQLIEELKNRIEKKEKRLSEEKLGFFEKTQLNSDIKALKEKITLYEKIKNSLFDLYYSNDNNVFSFPNDIIEKMQEITNLLEPEENKEFNKVIRSVISKSNKDKKEKIQDIYDKLQKLLDKSGLFKREFLIFDNPELKLGYKGNEFYKIAISKINNSLLSELNSNSEYLITHDENLEEHSFITDLDDLIKSGKIEHDKSTDKILSDLPKIKEDYKIKVKCEELLKRIRNLKDGLNLISVVDISELNTFLSSLEKKYEKQLCIVEKDLSKYDFDSIVKQIDVKKEEDKKNAEIKDKMAIYQGYAYELEKAMQENSSDRERIKEIADKMEMYARTCGLSNNELEEARRKGIDSYHSEIEANKERAKLIQAKNDFEKNIRSEVMKEIREEAIKQLEASGAFKEEYEFRNGDVYAKPIDREAMIRIKIEELIRYAEMTPEQRGLAEFKKLGIVDQSATIEDLSYQQLNDIRIGYSDSSYGFIAGYKEMKKREAAKPKADPIYKEYLKYRAALEDKSAAMSFSDYAKKKHNIESLSEMMVSQDLLDIGMQEQSMETHSKGMNL